MITWADPQLPEPTPPRPGKADWLDVVADLLRAYGNDRDREVEWDDDDYERR